MLKQTKPVNSKVVLKTITPTTITEQEEFDVDDALRKCGVDFDKVSKTSSIKTKKNAKTTKILVIGDTHFNQKYLVECKNFIEHCVTFIQENANELDAVILLGDVSHTFGDIKGQPFNLIYRFFKEISKITKLFVIIGNHDLEKGICNGENGLSKIHFYRAYKKWTNVVVVDKPKICIINNMNFVMSPFIQPGLFVKTLDDYLSRKKWCNPTIKTLFCHQEIRDSLYGPFPSTVGDEWSIEYPPIVSGHVHKSHILPEGVYYPGDSIQFTFDEEKKRLWVLEYCEKPIIKNPTELNYSIIKLPIKDKIKKVFTVKTIEKYNFENMSKENNISTILKGTSDEFKKFKKSKTCALLKNLCVPIIYENIDDDEVNKEILATLSKTTLKDLSIKNILRDIVLKKNKNTQNAYEEFYNEKLIDKSILDNKEDEDEEEQDIVYKLVFIEDDEGDNEDKEEEGDEEE
jgi:predicted phosphodiesterase